MDIWSGRRRTHWFDFRNWDGAHSKMGAGLFRSIMTMSTMEVHNRRIGLSRGTVTWMPSIHTHSPQGWGRAEFGGEAVVYCKKFIGQKQQSSNRQRRTALFKIKCVPLSQKENSFSSPLLLFPRSSQHSSLDLTFGDSMLSQPNPATTRHGASLLCFRLPCSVHGPHRQTHAHTHIQARAECFGLAGCPSRSRLS